MLHLFLLTTYLSLLFMTHTGVLGQKAHTYLSCYFLAGVVKGRRMTTVPKCRFDLEACGGIYVEEPCVIDRNIVSWPAWHTYGDARGMAAFIQLLKQQSPQL